MTLLALAIDALLSMASAAEDPADAAVLRQGPQLALAEGMIASGDYQIIRIAMQRFASDRGKLVLQLRQHLASESNEVCCAAAYLAGLYRVAEVVPALLDAVDLTDVEWRDVYSLGLGQRPPWGRRPARDALVAIGLPAVEPILAWAIASPTDARASAAAELLDATLGPELARMDLQRREAAADEDDRSAVRAILDRLPSVASGAGAAGH